MKLLAKKLAAMAVVVTALSFPARAVTVNWIVWTNFPASYGSSVVVGGTTYNYATFASGYIIDPNTGFTNQVTYSGEVNSATASKLAIWANSSTYTSATVPNLPTPNNSYIALTGYPNLTNQLTFSMPISNFVMNIASLGNPSTTASYNFDSAPVVLSQGSGYWGAQTTALSASGNVVSAREGNGTIQFNGTFSSLTWTTPADEFYSAFTIGATSTPAAVPEPSVVSLLVMGFGGVMAMRHRRGASSIRSKD